MKNSNNDITNRTRDLPACSAVSQPTAPLQYQLKRPGGGGGGGGNPCPPPPPRVDVKNEAGWALDTTNTEITRTFHSHVSTD
jgi:hypothetical protein